MLVGISLILIGVASLYFNVQIADLKWNITKDTYKIQELTLEVRRIEQTLQDNGINPVEHKHVDTEV